MPVAKSPSLDKPTAKRLAYAQADVPSTIPAKASVGLIDDAGTMKCVPVGCEDSTNVRFFVGFADQSVSPGGIPLIVSGRGSIIEDPVVEGGGTLTPGGSIYLSPTPGEITQTPPSVGYVYRVGFALSANQMVMETDYRVLV